MKSLRRSTTAASPAPSGLSLVSSAPPPSFSTFSAAPPPQLSTSPRSSSWIHLRSLRVVISNPVPDRGSPKSPWSKRKRKHALSRQYWHNLFTPEGKFCDGGVKFLKKVRSGGADPGIRADVWPFLLGVYDLKSSEAERAITRIQKRNEYEKLRAKCEQLVSHSDRGYEFVGEVGNADDNGFTRDRESHYFEEDDSFTDLGFNCGSSQHDGEAYWLVNDGLATLNSRHFAGQEDTSRRIHQSFHGQSSACNIYTLEEDEVELDYSSGAAHVYSSALETESSDSDTSVEDDPESTLASPITEEPHTKYTNTRFQGEDNSSPNPTFEDFAKWQHIIRLDAIRVNSEWMLYSPSHVTVSKEKAFQYAASVGLRNYDHLEPCMVYHAARLVAILEAYAVYDPETGYCQGMSDLLSPIVSVVEEDYKAFWCFVGFMRKARQNFRLDESGIRRQLNIVSKIIKHKDLHLYKHLQKLQAEDCFFVYRMVVVLFRRELNFKQTLCLWEVIWADQAAIRAGIGNSTWGRIRMRAPPNDDLLLYAIAACVLQRRKLIIEKYSSMDEILRECNNMAGSLDVWKLLDDAHDLVITLHQKI